MLQVVFTIQSNKLFNNCRAIMQALYFVTMIVLECFTRGSTMKFYKMLNLHQIQFDGTCEIFTALRAYGKF